MILKDKVVVVSGIGPGLGQELAINAGQQGAKVVLAARRQAFLEQVEAEVQKSGAETLVVATDITDPAQCQNLVDKTVERFGRIDALINSAYSGGTFCTFEDANFDDWRSTMEVNLFGSLTLTQCAVPVMKKQGKGSVVMINTLVERKPLPMQAAYASSKGALSVDMISGATVTALAQNQTILKAARAVGVAVGVIDISAARPGRWTECVPSKIALAPVAVRIRAKLRMSTTRSP